MSLSSDIGIEDSQHNMQEFDLQLFGVLKTSNSDQSIVGKLLPGDDVLKRNLFIKSEEQPCSLAIFGKKPRKTRKRSQCDYRKNICGYITKRIIRQYLGPTFAKVVEQMCERQGCSYSEAKAFYEGQSAKVTGPSHIPSLLIPQKQHQIPIKASFREFCKWFLENRYIRYLLLEGKMDDKHAYIEYKNSSLMEILENNDGTVTKIQQRISSSSHSSLARKEVAH